MTDVLCIATSDLLQVLRSWKIQDFWEVTPFRNVCKSVPVCTV